jgi:indolepyruvate ferredoxin oxidoreductase beta subunit
MLNDKDPINVIITGVGGQGNLLVSQILGNVLLQKGYLVTVGETLGLSQRGGSVTSHVRASKQESLPPLIPEGLCDLILALEPVEGLRVLGSYGNPEILILTNTRPIMPLDVLAGQAVYPELDLILEKMKILSRCLWTIAATDMALAKGEAILANTIMLGALEALALLPFDRAGVESALKTLVPANRVAGNLDAFDQGRAWIREKLASGSTDPSDTSIHDDSG